MRSPKGKQAGVKGMGFLIVLILGVVLMTFTIITESEPGALPLLLVLIGAVGYATMQWKAHHKNT